MRKRWLHYWAYAVLSFAVAAHASINLTSTVWLTGTGNFNEGTVAVIVGLPSRSNTPGSRGYHCTVTSAANPGSFYIYGGIVAGTTLGDFWEFRIQAAQWVLLSKTVPYNSGSSPGSVANPGAVRYHRCEVSPVTTFMYVYGGSVSTLTPLARLWQYDFGTTLWTLLNPTTMSYVNGNSVGKGIESSSNQPSARMSGVMFAHPSSSWIYLLGGNGLSLNGGTVISRLNDLWCYNFQSGMWTWLNGDLTSSLTGGNFGGLGVSNVDNIPPGLLSYSLILNDDLSAVWMYGGAYDIIDPTSQASIRLNTDAVWRLTLADLQWTWMAGSNTPDQKIYATNMTQFNKFNTPGARTSHCMERVPQSPYILMFGGHGYRFNDTGNTIYDLNDLWVFDTTTNLWAWIAGGPDNTQNGIYPTQNVVSNLAYPHPRRGHGCALLPAADGSSSSLLIYGGENENADQSPSKFTAYNDVWQFNVNSITFDNTVIFPTTAPTQASSTKSKIDSSTTVTPAATFTSVTASISHAAAPSSDAALARKSESPLNSQLILIVVFVVLGILVLAIVVTLIWIVRRNRSHAKLNSNVVLGNISLELTAHPLQEETQFPDSTIVSNNTEFAMPGFLHYKAGIQFRWNKQIAKGGGGTVYLGEALDTHLAPYGVPIVVKIVGEDRASLTPLMSQAFDQEISVMHYLGRHRNIAALLGWCDEPVAMLMKYYAHGALDTYLRKNRVLSKGLKLFLLLDIAKGLQFMHSRGVAHCDMKTANVLVEQDSMGQMFCVLTDFGIAQMFGDNAQLVHAFRMVNVRGVSIKYAAPEAITRFRSKQGTPNMQAGFATDIFSLAVIMNEILQGVNGWSCL